MLMTASPLDKRCDPPGVAVGSHGHAGPTAACMALDTAPIACRLVLVGLTIAHVFWTAVKSPLYACRHNSMAFSAQRKQPGP